MGARKQVVDLAPEQRAILLGQDLVARRRGQQRERNALDDRVPQQQGDGVLDVVAGASEVGERPRVRGGITHVRSSGGWRRSGRRSW
jgi:hypothetical protein